MVDGAHNLDGVKNLVNFVKKIEKRKILVLGIAEDKKIKEMISLLIPMFNGVIVTEGSFKPTAAEELAKIVKEHHQNVKIIRNSKEAVSEALNLAKEDDFILVTGSLYLVGDVLKHKI